MSRFSFKASGSETSPDPSYADWLAKHPPTYRKVGDAMVAIAAEVHEEQVPHEIPNQYIALPIEVEEGEA